MKAKAAGTGNPRGRGTYNPACDVCARKKTKCDGNKPVCQPCIQQGREAECAWTKNHVRKPRTEQHFEAMHKRAENLLARATEYRRYSDYLESLLDQCQRSEHPHRSVDFRASRPSETDGLLGSTSIDMFESDFDITITGADDNDANSDAGDPTKEICIPTQSLKLEENGLIQNYGNTAPFRFDHLDPLTHTSRFPSLAQNPDATYVLLVEGVSDDHYNPDFDWSRHLPSSVPLDRRSHDKALDLLFKFFTSWCLRVVPALFLRDMYRALSVPASQAPPRTPHYSPMLHNALVALALAFLDDPKFRDLKTRQYFANVAKSFIEAECQKPNLSVVSALSILASFHSSQGDQTLGYMYFGMSARMSQALGLNVDCTEWVKQGLLEESERLDRQWSYWTTFSQDVCWSLYVGRDFCVSAPSEHDSLPSVEPEFDQFPWDHPPAGIEPQPNYLTKTFEATCRLLMISRRIMDVVNGLNRSRGRPFALDELISEIDLDLNTWRRELAPELEITVKSKPTATPHKLMLHLSYWWLFILLHRPFFHRKVRPISTSDREIDHVKLCRRAADNIMELLATWRSLYNLRYCPITLIQTVFSAGTVYLLTSIQASSGHRTARKELRDSMDQQKFVLQYLNEIGKSWQCATIIAGIMKNLVHEQLKPLLLERKITPVTATVSGALQIPDYGNGDDDDDEESGVSLSRSSSKGHLRRHSSSSKLRQRRISSHSRAHSVNQAPPSTPPVSTSPTITISPVNQQPTPYAITPSPACSAPILIQSHMKRTSSFSSSPSSVPDPWALRPTDSTYGGESLSPSPSSSPVFRTDFPISLMPSTSSPNIASTSPSTSFIHHGFEGYSPLSTYAAQDGLNLNVSGHSYPSGSTNGTGHAFHGQGVLFYPTHLHGTGTQPSPQHNYPEKKLSALSLLGMLGGQTLPQAPFVGPFSLADTVSPFSADSSFSFGPSSSPQFNSGFLAHSAFSNTFDNTPVVDNDTNMDDNASWDQFWAQPYES